MNQEILSKIKQLPPLPQSAMKIEKIYHDPDSSIADMVKVLEHDPLLTADILKAANSPLYGFSREIVSIAQAASLFGMGTIRGFALASIIKKSFIFDMSVYNLDTEGFSALSKKQHSLAIAWALKSDKSVLGHLSLAAFLIEIGKVLIAQYLKTASKAAAFKEAMLGGANISDLEIEFAQMTTIEVSTAMFEHWKFEPTFIEVVRYAQNPNEAPEATRKISQMLQVVRKAININSTITQESIEKAKELVKIYNLDMFGFERALELNS